MLKNRKVSSQKTNIREEQSLLPSIPKQEQLEVGSAINLKDNSEKIRDIKSLRTLFKKKRVEPTAIETEIKETQELGGFINPLTAIRPQASAVNKSKQQSAIDKEETAFRDFARIYNKITPENIEKYIDTIFYNEGFSVFRRKIDKEIKKDETMKNKDEKLDTHKKDNYIYKKWSKLSFEDKKMYFVLGFTERKGAKGYDRDTIIKTLVSLGTEMTDDFFHNFSLQPTSISHKQFYSAWQKTNKEKLVQQIDKNKQKAIEQRKNVVIDTENFDVLKEYFINQAINYVYKNYGLEITSENFGKSKNFLTIINLLIEKNATEYKNAFDNVLREQKENIEKYNELDKYREFYQKLLAKKTEVERIDNKSAKLVEILNTINLKLNKVKTKISSLELVVKNLEEMNFRVEQANNEYLNAKEKQREVYTDIILKPLREYYTKIVNKDWKGKATNNLLHEIIREQYNEKYKKYDDTERVRVIERNYYVEAGKTLKQDNSLLIEKARKIKDEIKDEKDDENITILSKMIDFSWLKPLFVIKIFITTDTDKKDNIEFLRLNDEFIEIQNKKFYLPTNKFLELCFTFELKYDIDNWFSISLGENNKLGKFKMVYFVQNKKNKNINLSSKIIDTIKFENKDYELVEFFKSENEKSEKINSAFLYQNKFLYEYYVEYLQNKKNKANQRLLDFGNSYYDITTIEFAKKVLGKTLNKFGPNITDYGHYDYVEIDKEKINTGGYNANTRYLKIAIESVLTSKTETSIDYLLSILSSFIAKLQVEQAKTFRKNIEIQKYLPQNLLLVELQEAIPELFNNIIPEEEQNKFIDRINYLQEQEKKELIYQLYMLKNPDDDIVRKDYIAFREKIEKNTEEIAKARELEETKGMKIDENNNYLYIQYIEDGHPYYLNIDDIIKRIDQANFTNPYTNKRLDDEFLSKYIYVFNIDTGKGVETINIPYYLVIDAINTLKDRIVYNDKVIPLTDELLEKLNRQNNLENIKNLWKNTIKYLCINRDELEHPNNIIYFKEGDRYYCLSIPDLYKQFKNKNYINSYTGKTFDQHFINNIENILSKNVIINYEKKVEREQEEKNKLELLGQLKEIEEPSKKHSNKFLYDTWDYLISNILTMVPKIDLETIDDMLKSEKDESDKKDDKSEKSEGDRNVDDDEEKEDDDDEDDDDTTSTDDDEDDDDDDEKDDDDKSNNETASVSEKHRGHSHKNAIKAIQMGFSSPTTTSQAIVSTIIYKDGKYELITDTLENIGDISFKTEHSSSRKLSRSRSRSKSRD